MFKALLINKDDSGYRTGLESLDESRLPANDVQVDIEYSTLNYKDALAITGKSPIARIFPLVPGIDLAGTVERSSDARFKPGDKVLVNGWGMGENHWGGLSQKARVPGDWLVHIPDDISSHDAMAIGTAGYTAMLCVMALERNGVAPEQGEVIVTGAAGGVGSVAIALLATLGYQVAASTGRQDEADYLRKLGATDIIDRNTLSAPGKPLAKIRWAGAVDSVGSHTLANVCAAIRNEGTVAACGLAQGMDFPASVAPFILRGVSLIGINSVLCPQERRLEAWKRLAHDLDKKKLALITGPTISLQETLGMADDLLAGKVRGRIVVDVNR
jgi:acrylyl-CoA reductase (NADPH)